MARVSNRKTPAKKAPAKKKSGKRLPFQPPTEVYGVPWIEIDFGDRPEGYKIHLDKQAAIDQAKIDSTNGPYEGGGGYMGPVRPMRVVTIPWSDLEKDVQANIKNGATPCFTSNYWTPSTNTTYFDSK